MISNVYNIISTDLWYHRLYGLLRGQGRRQRQKCQRIPAQEPSLGLAGHVVLEVLVVGLLQTVKGCSVLVIADACNPDVVGPEVRSGGKDGCNVGNELQWEGPGLLHLLGSCRCRNQGVDTLNGALDKVKVVTGELEVAKALAGVKIYQHVQEELVEQSVFLWGDKEGLGCIIFGSVLLEVEQAACITQRR